MNTTTEKTVEQTVYEMLVENTGEALGDSGSAYGRNHELNSGKSLQDFKDEESVVIEDYADCSSTEDIEFSINVFHFLNDSELSLDDNCNEFNSLNSKGEEWDYENSWGTCEKAGEFLDNLCPEFEGEVWNTYNHDSNLSQILQGRFLTIDGERYVLIQVHGGCDARGGYTDAKLFLAEDWHCSETVYGMISREVVDKNQTTLFEDHQSDDGIQIDTGYDGWTCVQVLWHGPCLC